jgi:hypothetical protein
MARDVGCGPAGCGQQLHHLLQRLRVFIEQCQVSAAPADGFEQIERARQRGFGRAGLGRELDHARHQGVEALAARL